MNKPILYDSGSFKSVLQPIPEPVHIKPGPFLPNPPVIVTFTVPEADPEPEIMDYFSPDAVAGRIKRKSLGKCKMHFGQHPFLVTNLGILVPQPEEDVSALPKVSLDIDFTWFETEFASMKLPPNSGPISKLESGFVMSPWKLVLSKKEDPEWHDFIMFQDDSFIISSIFWELHEVQTRIVRKTG